MTNLETHFVKPLSDFHGRKPGPGFAKMLEGFAANLSAETLESTARRLCENGGSRFPSFAQCRDALSRAEKALTAPTNTDPKPWDYETRAADDRARFRRAAELCRGPLGERAHTEGWLCALIDFCLNNGGLPNEREITGCIAASRRSEEALERARGTPLYPSLVRYRQNMIERAVRDVFGVVA